MIEVESLIERRNTLQYCLWCDEEIVTQTNWGSFLYQNRQEKLCHVCLSQLKTLNGNRCQKCSRESSKFICYDCERWEKFYHQKDPLTRNYSIYEYNDFMKEVITKWKYRGDYVLAEIFQEQYLSYYKQIFPKMNEPKVVIPIPLSDERLFERGFNQSEVLASFISQHQEHVLTRIHNEKQSKRTRKERLLARNPFKLNKTIYKSAILIDDIYTTGSTIRHVATLLKESGCPFVYSFTLIRG